MFKVRSGVKYYISDAGLRFLRILTVGCLIIEFSAAISSSLASNKVDIEGPVRVCKNTTKGPDDSYPKWKECLQEKLVTFIKASGNDTPTAAEMAAAIVKFWPSTIDLYRLKRFLAEFENEDGTPAYKVEEIRPAVKNYEGIPAGNEKDDLADILTTLKDVYAIDPETDTGKWKEKINKAFKERESPPGAGKMADIIYSVWKSTIKQETMADVLGGLNLKKGNPAYTSGEIQAAVAQFYGLTLIHFNTMDVRDWKLPNPKSDGKAVEIGPFYRNPKVVPVGLTWLDIDKGGNIHAKCYTNGISEDKLVIHIDSNGRLYSGGCSVLAIGPAVRDIQAGSEEWPKGQPDAKLIERREGGRIDRLFEKGIKFEPAFSTPPQVVVFLNELSMGNSKNWRIRILAKEITEKGFKLEMYTWADTVLNGAGITWIAFNRQNMTGGTFNTWQVRPWNSPQNKAKTDQRTIKFSSVFKSKPKVFVGLNSIDIDRGANLRIKANAADISQSGMILQISSWSNTNLYSAGVSFIAFE